MRARPFTSRQRGVAIVTVLLIVALATTVVASLYGRQNVATRSVENRLALSQARWIERAAIDWARVILQADRTANVAGASATVDYVGEPWSVPVADTRLDETVTGGARLDDARTPASIAGQMEDAQGRFNLNNLVADGRADDFELQAFRRLLALLGRSQSLADRLVAHLLRTRAGPVDTAAGAAVGIARQPSALPPKRLADLREAAGFDDATLEALERFCIFLPVTTSVPVNINTAPAEVLAARIPSLEGNLALAQAFVGRRDRQQRFNTLAEAQAALTGQPTLPAPRWSVASDWYLLRGVIRYERVVARTDTLLARRQGSQNIDVAWQDRY